MEKEQTLKASNENTNGLTSNALKIIAIIAMTIDHTALIFFPRYSLEIPVLFMHIIGRLAAPIMMFLIVEGYHYTRNLKKYILRLFIWAVLTHFSYAFAFGKSFIPIGFDQTYVIWAYMLGLIALVIWEKSKLKTWQKNIVLIPVICTAFPAAWSSPAALAILHMGRNRGYFKKQMLWLIFFIAIYSIGYFIFLNKVYGLLQMLIVLAIPFLHQYNGQRGNWKWMKWFFYIYCPLHLIILGLIRIFILQIGKV